MERAGTAVADAGRSSGSRAAWPSCADAGTTAATAASARGCCASAVATSPLVDGLGDLGEPGRDRRRAARDRAAGCAARGRRAHDRADQRRRASPSSRSTCPPASIASTGEVPGAAVRARSHGHLRRREGRARGRAGPVPLGLRARRLDRPRRTAGHEHALLDADAARRPFRARTREHEVPRRLGARRRRLARAHRRADARGARRVPRRRRLRHGRRAGVVAARARVAVARGGEARRCPRTLRDGCFPRAADAVLEPAERAARGRARAPASAEATARGISCGSCSSGSRSRSSSTPTRLWELEPFERSAPTVHDAALGRARAAARGRGRRGRRAPARVGAAGGVAVRRDGAAEGRRHARRLAARGRARRRLTARPSLATAGHRRRALGCDRSVPRQGDGAAARRRRGRGRARPRLAARRPAGRPRRERPAVRRSSARSRARAPTSRRSVSRHAARRGPAPGRTGRGPAPAATTAGRYQRGTTISRRSCSIARMMRSTTSSSGTTRIR